MTPGPTGRGPVEVSVGGVVVRDGELLLIRRGRGVAAGRWSLPGGRVEFGETLAEALAREVLEETGLAVVVGKFLGWVERMGARPAPYHFVILDFAAQPAGPEAALTAGDDADEARWTPLAEVATFDLVDGLADFLAEVGILPGRNLAGPAGGCRGIG